MQRLSLKKTAPFFLLATACAVTLGAASACGNTPATPGPTGTAGTNPGTAGVATTGGGGAATTGGNATGGNAMTAGNSTGGAIAGSTTGGTGGGAGGTPNMGGSTGVGGGMACKAVTPLNGAGVVLAATDISAFKYAAPPAQHITKMAYDPVGQTLVMINGDDGKLFSVDPKVALPTTAATAALTTGAAYNAGYTAPAGYGTGVYQPYRGLAFGPDGSLYVMAAKPGGVSIAKGAPPAAAGGARTWTTIVATSETFPGGMSDNYNHSFSGMAVSIDGKSLYFSSGSRTEHGEAEGGPGDGREYPLSSAIFKVPTDGVTDLKAMDEAGLKTLMFADGTRNTFDLALDTAFNPDGDLIGTENSPDIDVPDEVNFLEQGKHYGFPWRFGNVDNPTRTQGFVAANDKRLRPVYGGFNLYKYDAAFPAPPQGVTFTDPITNFGPDGNFGVADATAAPAKAGAEGLSGVTAHRSPLGLSFDNAGALCGDYYKQGLMLSYGPIPGGSIGDVGEDLLLVSLTKANGKYTMKAKQLASGIRLPMDSVLIGNRLFTIGQGPTAQLYVFVLPTP